LYDGTQIIAIQGNSSNQSQCLLALFASAS